MFIPDIPRIGFFWDFDKTLTKDYMQKALFAHYTGLKGKQLDDFLKNYFRKANFKYPDTEIPFPIMSSAINDAQKSGLLEGLTNEILYEIGKTIEAEEGLKEFFQGLKEKYQGKVDFYHNIVSLGFEPMIQGFIEANDLSQYFRAVEAAKFSEDPKTEIINGIEKIIHQKEKFFSIVDLAKKDHVRLQNSFIIGDNEYHPYRLSSFGSIGICVYPEGDVSAEIEALKQKQVIQPNPYVKGGSVTTPGAEYVLPKNYSTDANLFNIICNKIDYLINLPKSNWWHD